MTMGREKILGPMDILDMLESNEVLELAVTTDSRWKHW
jgi:hypothetical protein